MGPKRDAVSRKTGILDNFPGGPKVRWRTPIGGGYAGPAVVKDRVYVTDRILPEGVKNPANPFAAKPIAGKERLLCLSDKSGKILWKHEYDLHRINISYPPGRAVTPIVQEGKVYTLGAMGNLFCLNADDGKVIWSKNFVKDYKAPVPMWGFAANPLLDGDKLICLVGGRDHIAASAAGPG